MCRHYSELQVSAWIASLKTASAWPQNLAPMEIALENCKLAIYHQIWIVMKIGAKAGIVQLCTVSGSPFINGKVPIVAYGAMDDGLDAYESGGSDGSNFCTALQWLVKSNANLFNAYRLMVTIQLSKQSLDLYEM
ncbi:hypothetical protein T11_1767, partial [Trichinella zimbabwensis]